MNILLSFILWYAIGFVGVSYQLFKITSPNDIDEFFKFTYFFSIFGVLGILFVFALLRELKLTDGVNN